MANKSYLYYIDDSFECIYWDESELSCLNFEASIYLQIGVSIPASEIFIQNEDGFLGKGGYGGVYLGFIKYLDAVAIKRQLLHGSKITMEKSRDK